MTATLFLAQSASAGLFGPSNEILNGEPLAQKLRSRPLVISVSASPLDVRSKSAAIGGFLLGFVVSSAMASGPMKPGMNTQQIHDTMQRNMQAALSVNQNIQTSITQMAAEQASKSAGQVAREGPLADASQRVLAALAQTPSLKIVLPGPTRARSRPWS